MRSVKQDELLGLASYEGIRDQFRARLIDHKKRRRILLGPEVSLMFEDHDSVMLQVQEMLRTERISDPTAVRFELETYNDLVPPDGALLATLMIEEPDQDERERKRREYVGLDRAVFMEIGARRFAGRFSPEGLYEDRIAVVLYVRFDLGTEGGALLKDFEQPARLVCDHPKYTHAAVLSRETRASLANDLDPANAESARGAS